MSLAVPFWPWFEPFEFWPYVEDEEPWPLWP